MWALSGTGVQAILKVVLLVVLARILGPTPFGVFGAAMVVANYATIIGQLGIGTLIVQRRTLDDGFVGTALLLAVCWAALVSLSLALLAPFLGQFFGFVALTNVILSLCFVPLFVNSAVVAEGLLRRGMEFRKLAVLSMIAFVASALVGIGLALLDAGVWTLVGAELTEHGARSLLLLAAGGRKLTITLDRRTIVEIFHFSGGLTSWTLGQALAQSIDNVVVGRSLGAEALGLYSRAYQLTSAPAALIGRAFLTVLIPVLSRFQEDQSRLAEIYRRSASIFALIGLPMASILVILSPDLVIAVFGPAWGGIIVPLQFLAIAVFFRLSFQLANAVAVATGAVYHAAWRHWAYAGFVATGAAIGQRWGIAGVAIGVALAQLAHFALVLQLSLKLSKLPLRSFLGAHAHGLMVAGLLSLTLLGVLTIFRALQLPSYIVVILAGLAQLGTFMLLVRLGHGAILGTDGIWLLRNLLNRAPRGLRGVGRILNVAAI